jgi:hypothetical protein
VSCSSIYSFEFRSQQPDTIFQTIGKQLPLNNTVWRAPSASNILMIATELSLTIMRKTHLPKCAGCLIIADKKDVLTPEVVDHNPMSSWRLKNADVSGGSICA